MDEQMPVVPAALGPSWRRPAFVPGGGDARVLFWVVGARALAAVAAADIGETAVSEIAGLSSRVCVRDDDPEAFALVAGAASGLVGVDGNACADVVDDAASCLIVSGSVADPRDLGYLRASIGLVGAALASGGTLVVEPQALTARTAGQWREEVAAADVHRGAHHIRLLRSEQVAEGAGRRFWVRTRGMRLYGRGDISIQGVAADELQPAADLMVLLCELQIRGAIVLDGQRAWVDGPFADAICRRRGDLDDPDFDNWHVAIERRRTRPLERRLTRAARGARR